ncbi:MAG: DUF4142 domain-containing protein [Gammaproteobacteria bacterium]|nr:DUF4142 domain-containing protein [Gammaproteobacteria bacterium]
MRKHQQAAQLLEYEIGSGQDDRVRGFAAPTLPTVMDHLEQAQQLLAHAQGNPPRRNACHAAPTPAAAIINPANLGSL